MYRLNITPPELQWQSHATSHGVSLWASSQTNHSLGFKNITSATTPLLEVSQSATAANLPKYIEHRHSYNLLHIHLV